MKGWEYIWGIMWFPGKYFPCLPPVERIGLGFAANCKVVWMGDFSIMKKRGAVLKYAVLIQVDVMVRWGNLRCE